jgi:hypothetical protein
MADNFSDDILRGRGEIAAFYLGSDTSKTRRRITALMREVRPENRIPFYLDGGVPCSCKSWLEQRARDRAHNLIDPVPSALGGRPLDGLQRESDHGRKLSHGATAETTLTD